MAKGIYIGIDNIARKVNKIYIGKSEELEVLDYIESTGTQYIDTLDTITALTKIELDFQLTSLPNVSNAGIVGAYQWNNSSQTNDGMLLGVNNNKFQFAYASGFAGSTMSADLNRHTAIMNINNQCTLDGNKLIDSTNSNGILELNKSIHIFGTNGGTGDNRCAMKLYSYKKYENNILVQDFIPVRISSGLICMYDKVTERIFTNIGTGDFISGEPTGEKINLGSKAKKVIKGYVGVKETYKVLDYIESNGTQYIDTEITANAPNLIVEIDGMFLNSETNYIAGAYDGSTYYGLRPASATQLAWHPGVASITTTYDGFVNTKLLYKFDKGDLYINDELVADGDEKVVNRTLYLFGRNGATTADALAKCRIYSCKMYQNNVLVRNLIPIKTDTGIICLYDKVSGKKFYNKGTGEFIGGEETGETLNVSKARIFFGVNKVLKSLGVVGNKQYSLYFGTIASTSSYFIMAGGSTSTSGSTPQTNGAEAFDINFVRTVASALTGRTRLSPGSIGGRAVFIGGYTGSPSYSSCSALVETYDNALVKSSLSNLTSKGHNICVEFNDNHLMAFGASQYNSLAKTVDSYNHSLVKTQCTNLNSAKNSMGHGKVGNYLMCAGGATTQSASGSTVATVEAYSNDLVKTTCSNLDTAVRVPTGVWVNGYCMFIGGSQNSDTGTPINTINVYDETLTKRTSMRFPVATKEVSTSTINGGKYAIVGSGRLGSGGSYTYPLTYYVYDEDLVLIKILENTGIAGNGRDNMATIGDIACRADWGSQIGAIGLVEEEE